MEMVIALESSQWGVVSVDATRHSCFQTLIYLVSHYICILVSLIKSTSSTEFCVAHLFEPRSRPKNPLCGCLSEKLHNRDCKDRDQCATG